MHDPEPGLATIPLGLDRAYPVRPGRFDEPEDGGNVAVCQKLAKSWHAGRHGHAQVVQNCLATPPDVVLQHGIIMVPGVAGCVMRRGRKNAVFVSNLLVGRGFELVGGALPTMLRIELGPSLGLGVKAVAPSCPDGDATKGHGKQRCSGKKEGRRTASSHDSQIVGIHTTVNIRTLSSALTFQC